MSQPSVFISHSNDDQTWCEGFVETLRQAGLDVWYDQKDLLPGTKWISTVEKELQTRVVFVVILSPSSWSSRWVREEIDLALYSDRRIIPVLHKEVTVDGFMLTRQMIGAIGLDYATAARKLLEGLGLPVRQLPALVTLMIEDATARARMLSDAFQSIFAKVNSSPGAVRKLVLDRVTSREEAQTKLDEYQRSGVRLLVIVSGISMQTSGAERHVGGFLQEAFFQRESTYLWNCPLIVFSDNFDYYRSLPRRPKTNIIRGVQATDDDFVNQFERAAFTFLTKLASDNL